MNMNMGEEAPAVTPATMQVPPHPCYTEMITAAILWENSNSKSKSTSGASKRAIGDYIDRVYTDLPPSHSSLLTHHLQRLKDSSQLVMLLDSYHLPSLLPRPGPGPEEQHQQQKRPRGRPPKQLRQVESGSTSGKRPRGRPPKQLKVPFVDEEDVDVAVKRPRGRPPKKVVVPFVEPEEETTPVSVSDNVGRKRGQGNVSGLGKVDRRMFNKGRPNKNSVLVKHTSEAVQEKHTSEEVQETANEELLRTLEEMQSKLKDVVGVIRPHLANQETAPDALTALQQLEELSTMNLTASPAIKPIMVPPVVTVPTPALMAPETSAAPSLTDSTIMAFTAPAASSEPLPFSMNVPSVTVNAPLDEPSSIPLSWFPTGEALS